MDSSRVERQYKRHHMALCLATVFVAAEFLTRGMEGHPVWSWLAVGAVACYLFFAGRLSVTLYRARCRRHRDHYPH